MSWFGHTNRIAETSTVKRIHKRKPFIGRPAGRAQSRWDDADAAWNGLHKMKLVKWAEHVQRGLKWRDIVGKAETVSEEEEKEKEKEGEEEEKEEEKEKEKEEEEEEEEKEKK